MDTSLIKASYKREMALGVILFPITYWAAAIVLPIFYGIVSNKFRLVLAAVIPAIILGMIYYVYVKAKADKNPLTATLVFTISGLIVTGILIAITLQLATP
jgi:hypothetical protein